jgi:hypothetical protein
VLSHAYVPAIPLMEALCSPKRGHRDKPGDDKSGANVPAIIFATLSAPSATSSTGIHAAT